MVFARKNSHYESLTGIGFEANVNEAMNNQTNTEFSAGHLTMNTTFAYLLPTMRTHRVKSLLVIALIIVLSNVLIAQNGSSVTQSVTIEVKPISKLAVTGNPNALIITDATAGSALNAVSDNNTKYNMLTNMDNMKIVASIDNKMPDGTKLMVKLGSTKGSSTGVIDLSNALTPVDVVTGINKGSENNQSIEYTFAANADVGQIQSQSRTITLTLTN